MTDDLKDMMAARAEAAPGASIDIQGVIRNGQRRVWRNRAVGGTATCAAVAAVALVVPSLSAGGDDPGVVAGPDGFATRTVTYAEGSTIHYGDETIDLPREVRAFVQTDDGFVFADADDTVYFTDGDETSEIGHAGGSTRLDADDSGSYVAWVEIDEGERPETVVYDTSIGAEVLRTDRGNGPGPGYVDYDKPSIEALDGDLVYVQNGEGLVAIDIPTGRSRTLFGPGSPRIFNDAADGLIGLVDEDLALAVRTGLDGHDRGFPDYLGAQLSPSGTRVLTNEVDRRPASVSSDDRVEVLDLPSGSDVTPQWGDYAIVHLSQWIDDDTLVAYGLQEGDGPIDLLRCSIPDGDCTVAASPGTRAEVSLPIGAAFGEW